MKLFWQISVITLVLLYGISNGQGFYDTDQINKIEIYFQESNWDSILHEYWRAADEERLLGSVSINGQSFDSVGIRYKGYSSYDKDYAKKPLNIKLDHIRPDQSMDGVETIKLSNGFRDPSIIREVLGYEIIRKYMPAGRSNFTGVYINNEYFGIYSSPENVDRDFIEKHFYGNDGIFIKGAPRMAKGGLALTGKADLVYKGSDSTLYYRSYEVKSDYGWNDLIELCDIINNKPWEMENVFNVDRALWLLAFHNLLVSLDSPLAAPRNFYLYKDATKRFNIIPWDLNMVFGTYRLIDGTWDNDLQTIQQLDPLYHKDSAEFPLVKALLQNSRYRKMYLAHMRTILNENITNGWYKQRAEELQSIIDSDVQSDQKMFYSYNEFLNNIDQTIMDEHRVLVGIAELMEGRKSFLNNHILFQTTKPEIMDVAVNSINDAQDVTVRISCTIKNAESVQFVWRNSMMEAFTKSGMYDDGQHNDGALNDDIYGASIKSNSKHLQYYIYAENNEAAVFSPERAEYEYFTQMLQPGVIINELLAINNANQSDQDGEFDDWIELYNNSDSSISLTGLYLSDNGENLLKWPFPDTVINAHDYLIIWADEDGSQEGLHANFKLSGNGESLFLVDSNSNVIDEVQFGPQNVDVSYGRLPNGTGDFFNLITSFSSENLEKDTMTIDRNNQIPRNFELLQNYPNPFNAETRIEFYLPHSGNVELAIYDVLGQEVESINISAMSIGWQFVIWDGRNRHNQKAPSGIYFYKVRIGNQSDIKKMILLN